MQDPAYQVIKSAAAAAAAVQFPEQEQLKCPRCESTNTKFCYYNNYNLSQPRHFCKNCRRYWTKGGALRNIPVGGGSRKSSSSSASSSSAAAANVNSANSSSSSSNKRSSAANASSNPKRSASASTAGDPDPQLALHRQFGVLSPQPPQPTPPPPVIPGSFSSLLASNGGQFGGGGFIEAMGQAGSGGHESGSDSGRVGDGYWVGGGNGWPDLAIYTPGTNFQ